MRPDESGSVDDHNDEPVIEDATEPEHPESDEQAVEALEDDEAEVQLDAAARELVEGGAAGDELGAAAEEGQDAATMEEPEDAGDVDSVQLRPEDRQGDDPTAGPREWQNETSAHKIAVELKGIETSVRELLEGRDNRRKRRLSGTRRWLDLQDDILSWRASGRIDRESLDTLERLVARRHYLFRRLHFLAGTRHGWNT